VTEPQLDEIVDGLDAALAALAAELGRQGT
jgi:hypothetical protein